MRRLLYYIAIALIAVGCMKEPDYPTKPRQRLVVDGRIEVGHGAIVALSLNTEFREDYSEEDFRNIIVRWAKVTVECDGESEVLTGRSNHDYPTQFIYTGSDIIGQEGRRYDLIIEYSGRKWRATTTIPPTGELSDITVNRFADTLYTISATLPATTYPCAIDCSLDGSSYYEQTMLGIYDACDTPRRININRPLDNLYASGYMAHFHICDNVALKLRTMDRFGYEYWSLWENCVINRFNPIFPAVDNLPTNISNDAIGIWAGYGTKRYKIDIPNE